MPNDSDDDAVPPLAVNRAKQNPVANSAKTAKTSHGSLSSLLDGLDPTHTVAKPASS
jgi:hypothetical protein